ncbi:hypothetical protein C8Q76DRAFT_797238 [Earliella scabrosa]|nr:hypothetical protein C8Q76DRAFT_797238 [Earliella scabrosa]
MHPVFSIAELLHHIATLASHDTLPCLIRTCKAFHKHAIQELWRDLPDLSPILGCFPSDAWSVVNDNKFVSPSDIFAPNPLPTSLIDHLDCKTFVRSLAPDDWERFLYYAQYVRSLGCNDRGPPKLFLDRPALLALSAFRPTLILFPSLRELRWESLHLDDGDMPLLLGLLGPQMTTINVQGWDLESDDPERFLQSLQSLKTSLAIIARNFPLTENLNLDIGTTQNHHLVFPSLLLVVEKLKRLTVFGCGLFPVSVEAFTLLGQLNNLTTLSLRLTSPLSWSLPAQLTHGFPSLQYLTFGSTAYNYIRLGAFARFPTVVSLHLGIIGTPEQHEIPGLFTSISAQMSVTSLQYLSVIPDDWWGINRNLIAQVAEVVLPEHLQPLLSFKNLKFLDIGLESRYSLNAEFYNELAQAFPSIRSLIIGDDAKCMHDTPFPHIRCLASFAHHCPSLSELSLCFDGTQLSPADMREALPPGASPSCVRSLSVGRSPVKDASSVAAYIARIFPELKPSAIYNTMVDSRGVRLVNLINGWNEVRRLLPWFKVMREVGRQDIVASVGHGMDLGSDS